MVRDILVEVRQNQQQLEHPVTLIRIGLCGAFFQIFHDHQSIGEEPFKIALVHGAALAAVIEGKVSAQKSFLKKMIETQSFSG
jgi:hypothetical protein